MIPADSDEVRVMLRVNLDVRRRHFWYRRSQNDIILSGTMSISLNVESAAGSACMSYAGINSRCNTFENTGRNLCSRSINASF
jgi:hypothetical protein